MNNFQTIIIKIKHRLSHKLQRKVHDKDVAHALGIPPSSLASMKRRNTIPYRAILDFCVQHNINANNLLFQRPVNNTIEHPPTIRYYQNIKAGAGGGANVLNEHYTQMTLHDFIHLFLLKTL